MTTHGRGGWRRAWLGSVADALVRSLEIPLILIRPSEKTTVAQPTNFDQVVVPLDGSPLAEAVLGPVTALARACDSEVTLVQVVRLIPLASDPPLPFPTGYAEKETQIQRDVAQDYLQDIASRIRESGVKATGQAVIGDGVANTLLDFLHGGRAALVAIATHGRGGVRRLVLGSVADKLIRAAEVPVMVVRPRAVQRRTSRSRSKAEKHSLVSNGF
jgi:nucleotide-binding universal stress UspA family protein